MTPSRTVTPSAYQVTGVASSLYTVPALSWAPKRVSEAGLFAVDFVNLLDDGDAVMAAAVTVVPDVPGGLMVMSRRAVGTGVQAMLAGGAAGATYSVTVSAATIGQSLHPQTVQLQVIA